MDFVLNTAKPLFESWGYEVVFLKSEKDYLDLFYHVIDHPTKHMEHKGMTYGFPISRRCVVKRDLKEKPMEKYINSLGDDYIQYLGICIDEPTRLASMHKNPKNVSLLEKYGCTQGMNRQLCEEYGLLSPTYNLSNRGGCWFCPNAKLEEHKEIKRLYPEVWQQFVSLEKVENLAFDKWNVFGCTLEERDKQIERGEEYHQMSLFDFGI